MVTRSRHKYGLSSLLIVIALISIVTARWSYLLRHDARIEQGVELVSLVGENKKNPAFLIRAVNHMVAIGHSESIEVLRRFVDQYSGQSALENIEIIVPLAFLPNKKDAKLPSRAVGHFSEKQSNETYILDREKWNSTIEVFDGIPFQVSDFLVVRLGPGQADHSYLIDWAEESAKLRPKLVPAEDPFAIAQQVSTELIVREINFWANIDEDEEFLDRKFDELRRSNKSLVRRQVYELVRSVAPAIEAPKWDAWTVDHWRELETTCKQRGFSWSEQFNRYVRDSAKRGQ